MHCGFCILFLIFFDGFICLYLSLVLRIFLFIVSFTQRGRASIYVCMYHTFLRCCPQALNSERRSHYLVQADSNAGLQLSSRPRLFQGIEHSTWFMFTAVGKHYFCYFLWSPFARILNCFLITFPF